MRGIPFVGGGVPSTCGLARPRHGGDGLPESLQAVEGARAMRMALTTTPHKTDRVAALSDGVFAISMTLLVLNLRVPETAAVPLPMVFAEMFPRLDNWLITFLVSGALWVVHHNMLAQLRGADTPFLWLNLLFLMCISFLPYPTARVSLYPEETAAVILFSGSLGLAGLVLMAQWVYASHDGRLTAPHLTPVQARLVFFLIARVPMVAAFSMLIAVVDGPLGLYSWLLVTVLGFILRRRSRLVGGPRPEN